MRILSKNIHHTKVVQSFKKTGGAPCPHGNPAGVCPLCLGMGGGGGNSIKDKPKPTAKELGLLTWADLLPAWLAMQAAKRREEYNQKLELLHSLQKMIERSKIYQTINNFVETKIMPAIKFMNAKILTPLTKALNATIQTVNSFYTELKIQMTTQIAKLAGSIKQNLQFAMEKLKYASELIKNAMEMLVSNLKEKEKALKEFLEDFVNKLRKKLFRIVESSDNSFENMEDQKYKIKEYEEDYEELINV